MSKESSKNEEVKISELERRIGDTPIAQKISCGPNSYLNDFFCVCDFLSKDAIRRIAWTAREYLRDTLVPDDD